jgi:predicted PurR-regulated permease PerM
MIPTKSKITATEALVGIWTLALTAAVIGTLYYARELLIPLALSALLTFLLAPLVTRIERWIGRIAAVLLVVLLIFMMMGAAGWLVTRQLVDLGKRLPEYKGNIVSKMHAFQVPKGGAFTKVSDTVEELKAEFLADAVGPTDVPARPIPSSSVEAAAPAPGYNPLEIARAIIAPLVGPLGLAALVLVLVICMLFQREALRSRLIRLIGQGRISATTRAMDDAGDRVSRYLLMQLLVNVTYGTAVAIGLYFISVPNALLWGACGLVLRFIPYVGPWVATILPTLLALAISPHWTMPILTVALFAGLELLLNNVMEPLLYGAHTGVSSIALIVAAVFWAWLWGPLGLVLATPLTVCLVVMGRHVPRLSFLSIILSDEDGLTPAEDCYHRLLTPGDRDELELVESYLKTHPLVALYDLVFIPALAAAEMDAHAGLLEPPQLGYVKQSLRDIIEDLGTQPNVKASPAVTDAEPSGATAAELPAARVYCLPARAERDEIAGCMLSQLLRQQGLIAENAGAKFAAGELLALVEAAGVDAVCISVVPPSTVIQGRYLCGKLRAALPRLKIVVVLWGGEGLEEARKRLHDSGADEVVDSLPAALTFLVRLKMEPEVAQPLASLPRPASATAALGHAS